MARAWGRSELNSLPEVIESFLLSQVVHAGWSCRFLLEGEMHALVAAVLRGAWLDALDVDSKAQPPDGELAQVEQGVGAGEGHAVVGADGFWQAAFLERTPDRVLDDFGWKAIAAIAP
jgi:hypothetical protein